MKFKCDCGKEYEVTVKQSVKLVSKDQEQLVLAPEFDEGVPLRKIVDLYHEMLPELPKVKKFTDARKVMIVTRWREDKARQSPEWWRRYFRYVARKCPFLTGSSQNGWRADFDFLLNRNNMQKVIEGKYLGRRDAAQ